MTPLRLDRSSYWNSISIRKKNTPSGIHNQAGDLLLLSTSAIVERGREDPYELVALTLKGPRKGG